MQNGPRLFLVTSVTRPTGDDDSSGTIAAYMFVVADRDDSPGSAAGDLDEAIAAYEFVPPKAWGSSKPLTAEPTPSPDPTESATPDPTPSPTPTGTPSP
jgi:hypothetical protein